MTPCKQRHRDTEESQETEVVAWHWEWKGGELVLILHPVNYVEHA